MANKRTPKKEIIFPLSFNPKLSKDDIKGIDVYFSHLDNAFKNPRIRNIAVTGAYGVGKSSIIKSFDVQYCHFFKKTPKFLYISLGQYDHTYSESSGDKCTNHLMTMLQQQSQAREKNAIEWRLLLQIYAKFKKKNFPASGFRQIPEHPSMLKAMSFTLFAMAIFLLVLKAPLAQLLRGWDPQTDLLKTFVQWILDWHKLLEASLYGIVLIGAAVLFVWAFRWFGPRIKSSGISLKATNAELNLEESACEDYLDQYTQELVYCLKQVRKKIGRTVVFEDMDRLDKDLCISVFTRLREINYILNTQLGDKKYVRFIFVINDEIANQLIFEKFFDYVLPVIPALNTRSSEVIFRNNLERINANLKMALQKERWIGAAGIIGSWIIQFLDEHTRIRYFCCKVRKALHLGKNSRGTPSSTVKLLNWAGLISYRESEYKPFDCFCELESRGQDSLLHAAAPYLTDYRGQYTILNEYALMFKLYHRNNPGELTYKTVEGMLVFLIYKYLWPEDYQRCIRGEQNVLTGRAVAEAAGNVHTKLLQSFVDSGVLNIRCFYNAGFDENIVNALWRDRLCASSDVAQCEQIREIQADELHHIEILKSLCQVGSTQNYAPSVTVLAETVKCLLRYRRSQERSEHDWFFSGRNITVCLTALSNLSEEDCTLFVAWCRKPGYDYDIFAKCKGRNSIHMLNGKWTYEMAKIFVSGVSKNRRPPGRLCLNDGQEIDLTKI